MSTNHNVESPEMMESIGEAMSKTELFFENNGKKIIYAIFSLLVLAAAVFGYKELVLAPKSQSALELITNAQSLLEQATPDYEAALFGNDSGVGFLEVAEKYGSTPSGNLANHYAGICYLYMGEMESAAQYLAKYKATEGIPAEIVNAQNLGLQGDILVNLGDYKKAMELYAKAVKASDNTLTAPVYMRKAAVVAIEMGDMAKAQSLFNSIIAEYPSSSEARNAEKYKGLIK